MEKRTESMPPSKQWTVVTKTMFMFPSAKQRYSHPILFFSYNIYIVFNHRYFVTDFVVAMALAYETLESDTLVTAEL